MSSKQEIIDIIPKNDIEFIYTLLANLDFTDSDILTKYRQLKQYDDKLRRSESEAALEAYNLVDYILSCLYNPDTESENTINFSMRIVMSLMIYGCINIELDGITREEFIRIRTELRSWYKKFKKVVK